MRQVFASCSSYSLGQLFGVKEACALITQSVQDETKKLPCFAVASLRELVKFCEVTLRVDGGASHIGKSRSRHFAEAFDSGADVWLSIDDDVSATRETLQWMVQAVTEPGAHIVIAPCQLRGQLRVNVNFADVIVERRTQGGASLRNAKSGGFGLVAMNRAAMGLVAAASPTWKDPSDGKTKPAPFLEVLEDDGTWLGEDLAFFRRVPTGPKGVTVEAITSGTTMHAGYELALEILRA